MLKVKPESSISLSMEEEEEEQAPTSPFWIQTNNHHLGRLQRLFFNSFVLIIVLLLFALLSLVFIIPSIHLSSSFFRPNFVKRSWDSINLILVLIALLFGFLSRTINNDENEKSNSGYDRIDTEVSAGDPIMYDFQQQDTSSSIGLRRQRTSISYPDLRELSPPWNHRGAADPWRFSDDTHFNYYNVLDTNRNSFRQRNRRENNLHTPSPEIITPGEKMYFPPPQPPSQPPPANTVKHKTKRGKILSPETESSEKRRARSSEPKRILSPVIDPYPDPKLLQPGSPLTERNKEVDGNVSKEFFSSFYHKKKKKRQRDRSVDNLKTLLHHSQLLPVEKFISVTLPPPPPPPPPPPLPQPPRATITRVAPFVTDKPRTMTTGFNFNGVDDSSSGGESPMKNIPPPPPLPPFKMPDWKFAVEGDFVRLQGMLSDRSVSPDGDEARSPLSDVDTVATLTVPATEMAVFCPSPDVDTKADSFIARFRAGLKLERMSKLGPGSGSGPSNN
ncbi:hypothetical protein Hanom_Chr09g00870061 [Helianthus anomalus]